MGKWDVEKIFEFQEVNKEPGKLFSLTFPER